MPLLSTPNRSSRRSIKESARPKPPAAAVRRGTSELVHCRMQNRFGWPDGLRRPRPDARPIRSAFPDRARLPILRKTHLIDGSVGKLVDEVLQPLSPVRWSRAFVEHDLEAYCLGVRPVVRIQVAIILPGRRGLQRVTSRILGIQGGCMHARREVTSPHDRCGSNGRSHRCKSVHNAQIRTVHFATLGGGALGPPMALAAF